MSTIRTEIMEAQKQFKKKANVVADILNNIQNLYRVLNEAEVLKIQNEFLEIYQSGDMERLQELNHRIDALSELNNTQSL